MAAQTLVMCYVFVIVAASKLVESLGKGRCQEALWRLQPRAYGHEHRVQRFNFVA